MGHAGPGRTRLLPEAGSPGRALAWTVLCMLTAVLLLGGYFTWSEASTNAQLVATNQKLRAEQVQAAVAGRLIEAAICLDVGTMARIPPPAGPPASNPSRAYEQDEHRAWNGLFTGLGCEKK